MLYTAAGHFIVVIANDKRTTNLKFDMYKLQSGLKPKTGVLSEDSPGREFNG